VARAPESRRNESAESQEETVRRSCGESASCSRALSRTQTRSLPRTGDENHRVWCSAAKRSLVLTETMRNLISGSARRQRG